MTLEAEQEPLEVALYLTQKTMSEDDEATDESLSYLSDLNAEKDPVLLWSDQFTLRLNAGEGRR